MARNIEILRDYFLGKDPQLKETMADNSLRLIGIEGKHFVLRTELIARLEELKNYVDEKDTELREAIDDVIQDLENETEERINADEILQQNINTEKLQRQNADTTLQQNIDREALTRENVDAVLQNMINHEIDDRANADTTLQNNINAEKRAREDADTALGGRIDNVEADLENYYTKTETEEYVDTGLSTKQDTLTAGNNIEIINNVISAKLITVLPDSEYNCWELSDGIYTFSNNGGATIYIEEGNYFTVSHEGILFISDSENGGCWFTYIDAGYYISGYSVEIDAMWSEKILEKTSNKTTSISSSSTNTQYPSAKAVYDYVEQHGGGTTITYGTTDLTPGVSPLDEGSFYFQYE